MILGVLALDFAQYMRDDAMAAVNLADETRGYYLALAGMNRSLFDAQQAFERAIPVAGGAAPQQAQDPDVEPEGPVPPDGQWHEGTFAGGGYAVRVIDEGGRVSLNKADESVLNRIVTYIIQGGNPTAGLDRRASEQVTTIVESIIDWRDPDNLLTGTHHGAESDFYMKRQPPYRAKNSWFDSPEELLRVRGVTPDIYYGAEGVPGLRDVVSVFNREPNINPLTAPPAVLQVLLGLDAAAAADMVANRDAEGPGFLPRIQAQLTAVDPHLASLVTAEKHEAQVISIEARADTHASRNQSWVACVADVGSQANEGVRILRWFDRAPWAAPLPGNGEAGTGEDG
jgi:type II secretory pathway component PulK